MTRMLKISLAAFMLVGLATTVAPQASAAQCVGYGAGQIVADACNDALAAAADAVDTAEWLVDQVERCVPGSLVSTQWTCYHYP